MADLLLHVGVLHLLGGHFLFYSQGHAKCNYINLLHIPVLHLLITSSRAGVPTLLEEHVCYFLTDQGIDIDPSINRTPESRRSEAQSEKGPIFPKSRTDTTSLFTKKITGFFKAKVCFTKDNK